MKPYVLVRDYDHSDRHSLHFQGVLNMETKILVTSYNTTRRHNPEVHNVSHKKPIIVKYEANFYIIYQIRGCNVVGDDSDCADVCV